MIASTLSINRVRADDPYSNLERQLIADYLLDKGYHMADLLSLPVEQRRALMKAACIYASITLANIEAKCKFLRKIEAP